MVNPKVCERKMLTVIRDLSNLTVKWLHTKLEY